MSTHQPVFSSTRRLAAGRWRCNTKHLNTDVSHGLCPSVFKKAVYAAAERFVEPAAQLKSFRHQIANFHTNFPQIKYNLCFHKLYPSSSRWKPPESYRIRIPFLVVRFFLFVLRQNLDKMSGNDILNALTSVLEHPGSVLKHGSAEYEKENGSYFSAFENEIKPAYIARPASVEQVQGLVKTLRPFLLAKVCRLAIRGTGHTPFAGSANIAGGVTVDMRGLKGISLVDDGSAVEVAAGETWATVYAQLEKHGLSTAGGRVGRIGVAGFLLGGKVIDYLEFPFPGVIFSLANSRQVGYLFSLVELGLHATRCWSSKSCLRPERLSVPMRNPDRISGLPFEVASTTLALSRLSSCAPSKLATSGAEWRIICLKHSLSLSREPASLQIPRTKTHISWPALVTVLDTRSWHVSCITRKAKKTLLRCNLSSPWSHKSRTCVQCVPPHTLVSAKNCPNSLVTAWGEYWPTLHLSLMLSAS